MTESVRLIVAEEQWLHLAGVLSDEALARQLGALVPNPPDSPASLRALAALALVTARRIEDRQAVGT
jgi:hypothetical protein